MQIAHRTAMDAVDDLYEAADSASGSERAEGMARAAGAKLVANRIHLTLEELAKKGVKAPRRGLVEMLRALRCGP
ncbi:hypothetical protein [Falsiroseomonas sp.]|uniref:hypothetical protein n=1 Tax=Falsiroseomonas sp. TaxID=2870721 RepID=UPI00273412A2|nr:hypothetical protein [Falsiroseomonas sp.]MDP3417902.1 hypothetical protein [Falsiroseomonas sp.]